MRKCIRCSIDLPLEYTQWMCKECRKEKRRQRSLEEKEKREKSPEFLAEKAEKLISELQEVVVRLKKVSIRDAL